MMDFWSVVFWYLLCIVNVSCTGIPGLPPAESIEQLALEYQNSLTTPRFAEQRLFPVLEFSFRGRITGWKFAATENTGDQGGRPILGIWRPQGNNDTYVQDRNNDRFLLDECFTSMVPLENFTVYIHEGGPTEFDTPNGTFNSGDIIGLFMRPEQIADFVPYLYDGTLLQDFNRTTPFSFYQFSRGPRFEELSLSESSQDNLLPLLSLDLCSLDGPVRDVQSCDNATFRVCSGTSSEVMVSTTAAAITTQGTTAGGRTEAAMTTGRSATTGLATTAQGTTAGGRTEAVMTTGRTATTGPASEGGITGSLLVVVAAVPSALFFLLALSLVILVTISCLFARKRRHSSYTTDIRMEQAFTNGTHANKSPSEYDTVDPTFVISVVGEGENSNGITARQPAGNYEEPVVALSYNSSVGVGEMSNGMYESPILTPRSLSPLPTTPKSSESNQKAPEYGKPKNSANGSGRFPPSLTTNNNSPFASPVASPHLPRNRLRSNDNLTFRRVNSGAASVEVSPASDRFFRLESGVYVPTQDQRNNMAIQSLFDDMSYATFSKSPHSPSANNWIFFEESERFWAPKADPVELYDQLSSQKYREIHRKQIEIKDHLGSGEFGTVCRGMWHTDQGDLDIAVKMLSNQSSEQDKVRFLQEAAIIGQFKHPNIVRLHGVVTIGEPVMIVLELIHSGDLRKYLRSLRTDAVEEVSKNLPQKLLDFCSQIALGMEYLSRKEFIHRDLAARNILLTDDNICKIADFGMSRDLFDDDFYRSNGGKVPIKWTSPEAIHFRKYSVASDVWSFGVLMYEVWSLGRTPFKDKSPDQTIAVIDSGCRLAAPFGCPKAIYSIMIQCWNPNASHRPSFTKLLHALSQPTDTLFFWSPEDAKKHPKACILGAVADTTIELYPDLQNSYIYASADLQSDLDYH